MFSRHEYKQGVIYARKTGAIYANIEFSLKAQDEKIYESLKEIAKILRNQDTFIKISYVQNEIIDKKPDAPKEDDTNKELDYDMVLPKYQYIIKNMRLTDEEFYGKSLDGVNPQYRVIWKDETGQEYIVPINEIDQFEAKNPNGAVAYNSETHELIFNAISPKDVNYILRRYTINE